MGFDTADGPSTDPRRSPRLPVTAEVVLRRTGPHSYPVTVHNLSRHGCKLEFVERPMLGECLWVKMGGLEALEARVCWVEGFLIGVEFRNEIHPAVFDLLMQKLG